MTRAILMVVLLAGCGSEMVQEDAGPMTDAGTARPAGCDAWDWEFSHCMASYAYAKDSCIARANQAASPLECCQFNAACAG